jgi:hypothetical protein
MSKKTPITIRAAIIGAIITAVVGGIFTIIGAMIQRPSISMPTNTLATQFVTEWSTQISSPSPQPAVTLNFQPVINNRLNPGAQIVRIFSPEDNYLYMLDANGGKIIGAYKTLDGNDFNVDENFNCQPGSYGGYQVGPLVDILALPIVNAFNATVLGIDAAGNLLYCAPRHEPRALTLPALPNTNWASITALTSDRGNLYVLDSTSRAVWVFVGKDGKFSDMPYFYFSNQIPNIENAIDLAVTGDDLFLLHADGHLTTCTFSRIPEAPTRCVDPHQYIETRPDKDASTINSIKFSKIFVSQSPNQYIALLEPYTHSIYIFTIRSLQLIYVIEQQDTILTPELASAFAFGSESTVYFAIGNQIYSADLPYR